jgi:hypothetical protein
MRAFVTDSRPRAALLVKKWAQVLKFYPSHFRSCHKHKFPLKALNLQLKDQLKELLSISLRLPCCLKRVNYYVVRVFVWLLPNHVV